MPVLSQERNILLLEYEGRKVSNSRLGLSFNSLPARAKISCMLTNYITWRYMCILSGSRKVHWNCICDSLLRCCTSSWQWETPLLSRVVNRVAVRGRAGAITGVGSAGPDGRTTGEGRVRWGLVKAHLQPWQRLFCRCRSGAGFKRRWPGLCSQLPVPHRLSCGRGRPRTWHCPGRRF